jgi:signal transduction histidine kinase
MKEAMVERVRKGVSAQGEWLVGGGEMAKVIKAMDWSNTALGPMASWPQSLRTTVSLAQASNWPISLAWGTGHVQIYNDGYWPICGAKHPGSMGQDFRECWASAFPVIGEAYWSAWRGESGYLEKMRMFLDRNGFLEETWFTFSFSPITDESGKVGGLFHPVSELTNPMLQERRIRTLRDLGSRTSKAKTPDELFALFVEVFEEQNLDLPFVLIYLMDADRHAIDLVGHAGLPPGLAISPRRVQLSKNDPEWPLADVAATGSSRQITGIERRFLEHTVGPYPELPKSALFLPITQPGGGPPTGALVLGLSSRLAFTEPYRNFCDLVAATVSSSLANTRAYEQERQRAEALAEIDRAKTTFFSNVSHEFRTPLTLILGPVEDALAHERRALEGANLEAVHRSALRLLRLVNSLLDFARIEAGRLTSSYEPADLASLTAGLADSFRSLVESAGVKLVVECQELPDTVYVDTTQWEKIVLNLVSNAFKFTFNGSITVRLRAVGNKAVLTVADTGTGIPEAELARIFDRFHRVEGARGRSFEGTGIGLALVQELAKQHGGDARVESVVGKGSTFTVEVPFGVAHLPEEQTSGPSSTRERSTLPSPHLLEASQWQMSRASERPLPQLTPLPPTAVASETPAENSPPGRRGRILVADDNADMRDYVVRLLAPHFDVHAVVDGAEALDYARAHTPDLVLSDVMMPRMDGFALLSAIRMDPALRTTAVVLLSARAGEEAVVGGLESGADDYLVKPFAARELLGRVRTHLELARMRRASAESAIELAKMRAALLADVRRKNKELEAFSYSVSHDLRAPLRSVDGFSQALLEDHADALDAKGKEYLHRVRAAAKRMGQLIDDMIKLSRVERVEVRRESVDLSLIAQRLSQFLVKSDGRRENCFEIDPGLEASVDSGLAEILLENLLSNAWKFTAKTGSPKIVVSSMRDENGRVFYVKDNGAGFDMDHARRLFSPFQRLHSEAEFPGTGIGLATVQRIVERHGGRVWADGKVGEGATVYFTFPPAGEEQTQ